MSGTTGHPEEYGEWWLPGGGGPHATVVLVHGGFWKPVYDHSLEDAVAEDLAGRGYLVWNVEYRSAASPWPATLEDVAAAYDRLATGPHAGLVDRSRVAVVGHSAGGHLALWLAGRQDAAVRPALVVAQAPVADLARGFETDLGSGAVAALVGGSPVEHPERYGLADPMRRLPTGVPSVLVHGRSDDTVPIEQSERYLAAATAAGDACTLEAYDGGHYEHLHPASQACQLMRRALESV